MTLPELLQHFKVHAAVSEAVLKLTPTVEQFAATFRVEKSLTKFLRKEVIPLQSVPELTEDNFDYSPIVGNLVMAWQEVQRLKAGSVVVCYFIHRSSHIVAGAERRRRGSRKPSGGPNRS